MLKIINTLTAKIKATMQTTRSEAMRMAYQMLKNDTSIEVVIINKKDGTASRRVVSRNWTKYKEPVGGKQAAPGLTIFADICKVIAGETNPIISTYTYAPA